MRGPLSSIPIEGQRPKAMAHVQALGSDILEQTLLSRTVGDRIDVQREPGWTTAAHLDAVASELVGKAVSVSLIMKEQQQNNPAAADSAKDEPLVKSFLDVFRGDIAQIKPAKGE